MAPCRVLNGCGLCWRNKCFLRSLVLKDRKFGVIEDRCWVQCMRKTLLLFRHSGNASCVDSAASFYSGFVNADCIYAFGETLGIEDNPLDNLFQRTFGLTTLDNFQKFLVWQCYRGAWVVLQLLLVGLIGLIGVWKNTRLSFLFFDHLTFDVMIFCYNFKLITV